MIRRALCLILMLCAGAATAQDRRPSHCISLVRDTHGMEYLQKASFGAPLEQFTVRVNYVAHAMFLIETEGGVTAATDYTGFIGPTLLVPDVVTMNKAHTSHWTSTPDPRIPGWEQTPT